MMRHTLILLNILSFSKKNDFYDFLKNVEKL
jgi:hypothetical protein